MKKRHLPRKKDSANVRLVPSAPQSPFPLFVSPSVSIYSSRICEPSISIQYYHCTGDASFETWSRIMRGLFVDSVYVVELARLGSSGLGLGECKRAYSKFLGWPALDGCWWSPRRRLWGLETRKQAHPHHTSKFWAVRCLVMNLLRKIQSVNLLDLSFLFH